MAESIKGRIILEPQPSGAIRGRVISTPDQPGLLSRTGTFAKEFVPQVVGGALDALEQAADTAERILPLGTFEFKEGRIIHRPVDPKAERGFAEVAPAETLAGGITRGVSQFVTGFLPATRALSVLKVGQTATTTARVLGAGEKVAKVAGGLTQAEIAAQIASQAVFDPHEDRLSNLIEDFPSLKNPVTEYLSADPDDSEADARFKIALEGLALGTLTAGLIEGVRAIRAGRLARKPTVQAERVEPQLDKPPTDAAPDAPAAPEPAAPVAPAAPTEMQARARKLLERLRKPTPEEQLAPVTSTPRNVRDLAREQRLEAEAVVGVDDPFDQVLDILRGKEKAPKPDSLVEYLRKAGGLKESGGELKAIGITSRTRPGLINNKTGMTFDDAALKAMEDGMLPEFGSNRPSVGQFLDILDEDVRGLRKSFLDDESRELAELVAETDELLNRSGANIDEMSNAEVRLHLEGLEAPGTGVPRTLPDLEKQVAGAGVLEQPAPAPAQTPVRAGNINLDRINSPKDAKDLLRDTAKEFAPELDEARRGRISFAETERLANDLGMSQEQLLSRRRGQAFNAEEALAARRWLAASAEELVERARAAQGGSDEQVLAFTRALTRHVAIQEQVAGMTAEAGRALSAFNIGSKSQAAQQRFIRESIDSLGGRGQVEELAARVSALDDPSKVAAFARDAYKPRFRDKLFELWINNLLSGPQTHAVNVTSNTLTALYTMPEHVLAATFGAVRRGNDRVFFGEVGPRLYGYAEGAKDGLRYMTKALKTGQSQFDPLGKIETTQRRAISGVKGEIARIPGRFLQAEDDFFKAMGYRAELRTQAMRSGLSKGLRGKELAEHIEKIVAQPTDAIHAKALDFAREITFTRPLGPAGRNITAAVNRFTVARLIAPFIRTPTNLVKFAAQRSPLGLVMREVKDAIRAGGAERDIALARMTMGTAVAVSVAELAAEGFITGGGPSDPGSRAMLRLTGWQPYSVKIGDTYYSYNRLDPLGITIGVSADFAEISGHINQGDADQLGALIVGSISKAVINKNWLRGPADMIEAINDPDRFGERWLQSVAGTLIPTGVAQFARTQDPVLRDITPEKIEGAPLLTSARGIINKIKSRTPGYSTTLPPVRNVFGEPVILSGGLGPDLVSPVYVSRDRNDPVANELVRLDQPVSRLRREINGVRLTPQQYDVFQQLAGRPMKQALTVLMAAPNYAKLPDFAKKLAIKRIVDGTRTIARKRMIAANPKLATAPVERIIEEFQPAR